MGGITTTYFIIPEGPEIPQSWFDKYTQNYVVRDESLKSILSEEIAIFRAFSLGQTSPTEAAHAITRPISTSPIPPIGGYNDEICALVNLWDIIVTSLVEWPSSRTPDLIALLTAISETPDALHQGTALDDDGKVMTWNGLPYFAMPWRDSHWMYPEDIIKECPEDDDGSIRRRFRDNYLKTQDVEARLVAAGLVYGMKRALEYMIWTIECKLETEDGGRCKREAWEEQASEPLVPDFHIPALTCWIKDTGSMLYESLRKDEMSKWEKRDVPSVTRHFETPIERWGFWERRSKLVANQQTETEEGQLIKNALECALKDMHDIENCFGQVEGHSNQVGMKDC